MNLPHLYYSRVLGLPLTQESKQSNGTLMVLNKCQSELKQTVGHA